MRTRLLSYTITQNLIKKIGSLTEILHIMGKLNGEVINQMNKLVKENSAKTKPNHLDFETPTCMQPVVE